MFLLCNRLRASAKAEFVPNQMTVCKMLLKLLSVLMAEKRWQGFFQKRPFFRKTCITVHNDNNMGMVATAMVIKKKNRKSMTGLVLRMMCLSTSHYREVRKW